MECVVVAGAGGFIGGHLVRRLREKTIIRAVDIKPIPEWEQVHRGSHIVNYCLDLSDPRNCERMCNGAKEVYNLAANMGGIGFIQNNRVDCMRNVLINANLLEAAYRSGVEKYFFSSSVCVYPYAVQATAHPRGMRETDAIPADPEPGYGWEKLYSEQMCQEYTRERGLPTFIARFGNCYGPCGAWDNGREKAPAAICRKVVEIIHNKLPAEIEVWGNGKQTRTFMYIDDCLFGIRAIVNTPALAGVPVNMGATELVSIDELVDVVADIAKIQLTKRYKPDAATGVVGRQIDNTLLKSHVNWEPRKPLVDGMHTTYDWIRHQHYIRNLK